MASASASTAVVALSGMVHPPTCADAPDEALPDEALPEEVLPDEPADEADEAPWPPDAQPKSANAHAHDTTATAIPNFLIIKLLTRNHLEAEDLPSP